ncbi:rhodanese-like domain-containing protein [Simplicispira sedimenti]|uniref:rhodanese-like domain-containing protein n=1 Tax=Simplicispira sedimenti TaxID=2919500 RepID=UPI001FAA9512|nr:rhodanese-like domain-containing protein [Acidovorax sp. W1-6]
MVDLVRPAELLSWFAQEGDARPLMLDVREPWECALASVSAQGFELLAIPMGSLPARLAELDRDRPIACLCHHGVRSMHVAAWLAQQGWDCVANIEGGIDAWAREHDPQVPRY